MDFAATNTSITAGVAIVLGGVAVVCGAVMWLGRGGGKGGDEDDGEAKDASDGVTGWDSIGE